MRNFFSKNNKTELSPRNPESRGETSEVQFVIRHSSFVIRKILGSHLGNSIRNSSFVIPFFLLVSFLLFVAPYSAHAGGLALPPNNLGLVGYWPLNDGSGTVAADASGNSNTGTLANGPTWTKGKAGKAVVFDGSDDVITAGTQDTLFAENGSITISAWIYARSYGGGGLGRIVDRSTTADGPCFQFVLGKLYFQVDGATDLVRSGGTTIPLNQWVYVTATWDGSTNASNVKLYINGVEDSYVDNISGASLNDNSSATFRIGNSASGARGFDGSMDEVRVYNRVLTSAEILSLYKNSQQYFINGALTNTGLVGYWSLNDGSGTVATDFSGKGNNGTLVNGISLASPKWVDGKVGKALDFWSNAYVRINDNPSLRPTSITVSAWIKANSVTSGVRAGFVSKWFLSALWGYSIETGLASCDAGAGDGARTGIKFMFRSTAVSTDTCAFSNLSEIPGKWQHVVGTFDQSSGDAKIYIDGALISTVDKAAGTLHQPLSPLGIGAINDNGSWGKYFDGTVDEVRIYNRALSDAEVATLYNKSRLTVVNKSNAVVTSGLVGWWTMDGGDTNWSTGVITDRSGQSNNGSMTGFGTSTSPTTGKVGQALKFDGSTSYISTATSFSNPQTFTVSIWFKTTVASGHKLIGFETFQTGIAGGSYDRHIYIGTDGKIYFGWRPGGNTTIVSSATQNDGTWHHALVTHDGTTATLYIDGVSQGSSSAGGAEAYSGYWRIGSYKLATWTNASDGYYAGSLDDARIYSRALSPAEVKQLYALGR